VKWTLHTGACLLYTSYECLSSAHLSSTWIICTQYSLRSSTSCDNAYSTSCSFLWQCRFCIAYVHALHVLLYYSSCLRESFAPSTVYALLLHVTTISTVHLQPACSLHSLLRLQHVHTPHVLLCYSSCLRESFAPSKSTFFYFMRQWFLWYIYILHQHAASFSVPSLTFIRWKRMHGYTSLIRPRLHSTSTATLREHFHPSPTATFRENFRVHSRDNYNRKDVLVHLNLPSFFQQTDTLSGLFNPGHFVNISKQKFYLFIENTSPDVSLLLLAKTHFFLSGLQPIYHVIYNENPWTFSWTNIFFLQI